MAPTEASPANPDYSGSVHSGDAQLSLMSSSPEPVKKPDEKRSVRIPDLFSSIMSTRPVVNPNYFKVKAEGDRWIAKLLKMDEKASVKNSRVNLCYLISMWAPTADDEALRMMLDWAHWGFAFDDFFDEGHLKDDPIAAQEEVDRTMAIMEEDAPLIEPEENPIRYVFQTCWLRLKQRASPELQRQYKVLHKRFFDQLIVQVQQMAKEEVLSRDVQTYMEVRRGTIGAYPATAVALYAQGIEVPENVFSHKSIQEFLRISADLALLVNDILSYQKDLDLNVDHNLIRLLMEQGLSLQQAVDEIGSMISNRYKDWFFALADLPSYGEEIDRQALLFAEVCRHVALGNLHWSFQTGRYFGPQGYAVYETRMLHLSP
nr:terpene synthase [Hypoxylon sp. E7406B]